MARSFSIPARLLLTLILCATLYVQAAPPVHHGPPKKISRETIEALEEQWRQAMLAGDAAAMDRLLSDDYVGISAFGVVSTKAQQISRMKERTLMLTKLDISEIHVKVIGQIAIVTSLSDVTGTNEGSPIAGQFRYTRVYQRLPGGSWKITSFEATRVPTEPHGRRERRQDPDTPAPPKP